MKKLTLFSLLTTIVTAFSVAIVPASTSALGTAAFTLSPNSGSYNVNSTLAVGVYENGSNVNVVTANLTYNAAQLQFVSISPASGSFGGDVSSTGGSGNVSISRYVTPAGTTASGNVEVATVNFTVLVGSGTSTINFASSSMIESAGSNVWDGVNNSGTYNLTTPAPVTPPTTGTGSGSTGSTNTGTTTTPGSTPVVVPKPVTTPTTSTPAPTSTNTPPNSNKTNPKNSNNSRHGTRRLKARPTADKNTYTGYIYLALIVFAALVIVFGTRRKLALSGKQGTFFKSYKPVTTTEKPSEKK